MTERGDVPGSEGDDPDRPGLQEHTAAPRPGPGPELRTFLIADIRGYTTYTREHGDEAAAVLASRFGEIVDAAVKPRDGQLLELRGDEALVVFVSARQALRAAIDLQARIGEAGLPRGVGIGLDAGEAVPVDGGFRGTALNLAARLCGRAGPGDVLASEAVIHLAAHVDGIAYVEPRSLRFKGFDQPVRTVKVVAGDDRALTRHRSVSDAARALRDARRPSAGVLTAALAVIATVVGLGFLARSIAFPPSPPPSASPPVVASPPGAPDPLAAGQLPVLAFIDPVTGAVTDTRPFANATDVSTFFEGSFWILGLKPTALYEVDATTHELRQTIDVPVERDGGFAFADGTIWIADIDTPRIVAVDARTGAKAQDFQLDVDAEAGGIRSLTLGDGSIWAARADANAIFRVDPRTGQVQDTIDIEGAEVLEFGHEALWVAGGGQIRRIDPVTNEVTLSPTVAEFQWLPRLAFDGGATWTAAPDAGLVFRVARDGTTRTFQTGRGAGPLALHAGEMWVANRDSGSLSAIDVNTGELRTIPLGHIAGSLAAGAGQLMVAVSRTPDEEVALLDGDVLVVAATTDPLHFPNPDPAVNALHDFRTILFATCASLMHYVDDGGPGGLELVPEVAAAPPEVSADGLIYTFKIREGYAFSPLPGKPTEPLTAETFRYSLERSLSGKLGEPPFVRGIIFLDSILGAQAFHDGEADHVEGLSASGDTLTILLSRPNPVLLRQLTFPIFCPVPLGTPAVRDGVAPDPPLPSAGPYYIARDLEGLAVLLKNPNYHGDRPQQFDAIAILTLLDAGDVIARVDRGDADIGMATNDPTLGPASEIAKQWGPGSDAANAGEQRLLLGAIPGIDFVAIDTQEGPFADPTIRRAASLSLDREAIAAVWPEPPTNHLIPRHGQADPAGEVPGPRFDEALALMAGRTASVVFGVPRAGDCPICTAVANEVKSNLARIGITVTLREADDVGAEARELDSDIAMLGLYSQTQVIDPAGLLSLVVNQETPEAWLPEDVRTRLAEVLLESGEQRDRDAEVLAKRLDTDELLLLPYGGAFETAYVSPQIGCAFIHPAWYKFDLVAVCPKE